MQKFMELYSELFVVADQPTTCPSCGARTEVFFDMQHTRDVTQVHKCLSENCQREFVMVQDDDINKGLL